MQLVMHAHLLSSTLIRHQTETTKQLRRTAMMCARVTILLHPRFWSGLSDPSAGPKDFLRRKIRAGLWLGQQKTVA